MKSPFPGMDPYLEQHWGDVHHRLVTYICDQLQETLPRDLRARLEERVFVESEQGAGRPIYPDVRVIERRREGGNGPAGTERSWPEQEGGVAVAEPIIVRMDAEPATQGFIEIIDVGTGNRVVSVIEVLSPSNKLPGEGQELYLKKQRELRDGRVSLVEIDLVRTGKRITNVGERLSTDRRTPYQVCVRRGWKGFEVEVYPISIRERLPGIRIPLRESDKDAPLDLQPLLDECYRKGRYEDIDYRVEPNPPLDSEDAVWADELLRAVGRR